MRELSKLKTDRRNDDEEVWVKHYSSNHQILLVGEGDFSFSCSLASSFRSASNICASSLDSYDDVVRKYKKARSNLQSLKKRGASVLHGVDATKMQLNHFLNIRRFDRIIFNFPHAGFKGKETDSCLIRKHRELVFGFFHCASYMLRADGEIHVSHKNNAPFCHWNLEELASRCSLVLYQCVAFKKTDYRGYENKRGDGSSRDKPFPLGDCSTFKFRFCRVAKELYAEKVKWKEAKERESKFQRGFSSLVMSNNKKPVSFDLRQFQGVSQRPVSFPLSYRSDHRLMQGQSPLVQSRQNSSPFDFGHHPQEQLLECSKRFNGVCFEFYKGKVERMLTRRSSHHPCNEVSQEPLFQCSNRFNGVSHGIYSGKIRRMLTRTSFSGETQEQSSSRQSNLNVHPG